METRMRLGWVWVFLLTVVTGVNAAEDIGGLQYKRQEVFAFTAKPTFKKLKKDRYEIRFSSKGRCDATVEILNGEGKIIRHLASGVLGPNAPEPFKKNALEQVLIWDGKNNWERYVDDPDNCSLRVRLGLKPEFDKVLLWHPNRFAPFIHGLACDKSGVYVYSVQGNLTVTTAHSPPDVSHIQIFDHKGTYQKTILPIPSDKVRAEAYASTKMRGQGPSKPGALRTGPPLKLTLPDGKPIISATSSGKYFPALAPHAFTVVDGMVWAVASIRRSPSLDIFRLKTDGGMPTGGYVKRGIGDPYGSGPCWMAFSPDRKWIYFSGFAQRSRMAHGKRGSPLVGHSWQYAIKGRTEQAKHAVYRVPYDLKGKAKVFLGTEGKPGSDAALFKFPEGLGCDKDGNLYVADTGNNRVQVFSSKGKLVKSIKVPSPVMTSIHPKTGAIYVLSYPLKLEYFKLLKLNNLKQAKLVAEQKFSAKGLGLRYYPTFCLDPFTKEPTLWTVTGPGRVQLWTDQGTSFKLIRDLHEDLKKDWKGYIVEDAGINGAGSEFFISNITADPFRPHLYITPHRGGGNSYRGEKSARVNTETGEVELVPGATVMAYDGLAYLRQGNKVYRFDPETGKSVAFDYGEGDGGNLWFQFSSTDGIGFGVSPKGEVIYHDRWPPTPGVIRNDLHVMSMNKMNIPSYMRPKAWQGSGKGMAKNLGGYDIRPMYPGRVNTASGALLLFDPSGQLKSNDAVQGLPKISSGVCMDLKGNIWVGLPMAKRGKDGKTLMGHSVVKFIQTTGKIYCEGKGIPIPLKDPPKRPPEFEPLDKRNQMEKGPTGEGGLGQNAWADGMAWSFGGFFPFNVSHCVCLNARFDLDVHARCFIPEGHRQAVSVVDTAGNFILRVGAYGNCDEQGPKIRFGYTRFVAVNDHRLYVNDVVNKRIVSINLKYEQEEVAKLK